jgi:inner membrane protein
MKTPLVLRILVVAGLAILLLVPIALIQGKIHERRATADGVLRDFAAETAGPQTVAGPLIALTCEETYVEERDVKRAGKAETVSERKTKACPTGYVAPRSLKVAGEMPVESLHRGIYPIRLYGAVLQFSGDFEWPQPAAPNGANTRTWKHAYLVTAVRDPRGIKHATASIAPKLLDARSPEIGVTYAIEEDLGAFTSRPPGTRVDFRHQLRLVGTSQIAIAPVGDVTEITLASNWAHPSFNGAWTPDQRDISLEGFRATWRTSHLATGGQALWEKEARAGKIVESPSVARVMLFDPVNIYALSYRATEYGFLFVLFTFTAIALTEVVAGLRLHVMQYALVGLALAVFFLLLIALSEHIDFDRAYVAAALACVALIVFYLRHPLGTTLRAAAFGSLVATLYGALFVLLKSEDHALLMGSLLVFGALATLMAATRRLDWGEVAARMSLDPGIRPR